MYSLNYRGLTRNINSVPKCVNNLRKRWRSRNRNSATVYYRWDKPSDPDDGMHDITVEGTIPGISDKIGYIEVADLNESASASAGGGFPPSVFIFGSGIYEGHPADTPPERYKCAGE